jgi:hypothetical protein
MNFNFSSRKNKKNIRAVRTVANLGRKRESADVEKRSFSQKCIYAHSNNEKELDVSFGLGKRFAEITQNS